MFAVGATGDFQTPSSVKDFCWPFTKSNPGFWSGGLIIVPLAFAVPSPDLAVAVPVLISFLLVLPSTGQVRPDNTPDELA
jgi:hypothetical protein